MSGLQLPEVKWKGYWKNLETPFCRMAGIDKEVVLKAISVLDSSNGPIPMRVLEAQINPGGSYRDQAVRRAIMWLVKQGLIIPHI